MKNTENWEIKDRNYYLVQDRSPLTYTIASKHTRRFPLLYFDADQGIQRELRYASNQNSPFVDEQSGHSTLEHIVFENGVLNVPKEQQALQKLLSIYHPHLNKRYKELDVIEIANDELEDLEAEFQAQSLARTIELEHAEAILRVEMGSSVSSMSSKELKRDLLLFAKRNPYLFLELAQDENVELRNFAIKASEASVIKLSQDQRTFAWASNGKKLMTVPFEENPYSAFAAYLKTDEGVEVYKSISKKLN
jgi:hypothetical protein